MKQCVSEFDLPKVKYRAKFIGFGRHNATWETCDWACVSSFELLVWHSNQSPHLLLPAASSPAVLPLAQVTAGRAVSHICQWLHQSVLSSQSVIYTWSLSCTSTPAQLQTSLFFLRSSLWYDHSHVLSHISGLTFLFLLSLITGLQSLHSSIHSFLNFPRLSLGHYSLIISLISCWLDLFLITI